MQDFSVQDVEQGVINRLKQSCSGDCSFDKSNLVGTVVTCPEGRTQASINTTLVYANSDGSLTAYKVVNWTMTDFDNRINRIIIVNGVNRTVQAGPPDPEEPFKLSNEAAIGISFLGGFLAGVLIVVVVVVIV